MSLLSIRREGMVDTGMILSDGHMAAGRHHHGLRRDAAATSPGFLLWHPRFLAPHAAKMKKNEEISISYC